MLARRFLGCITILVLAAVALAFAYFQFADRVIQQMGTPEGHYQAPPVVEGPDYVDFGTSWLATPTSDAPVRQWADGLAAPTHAGPPRAAVFYVHPTTYLATDRWNATLAGNADSAAREQIFLKSQAGAFLDGAVLWAPRYRQAAYGAFLLKSDDAHKALDLAYGDVAKAFDTFLANLAPGQGIVLLGHSQGSLHLVRLLKERHEQLKGRMVAAYLPGWPISTKSDLPSLGFPACTAAGQSGCILSWMSFGEPANPSLVLHDWEKTAGFDGSPRRATDMLCVNPLTGTLNGKAGPQANLGTLVPSANFQDGSLQPNVVGAACKGGILSLSGDIPAMGPFVLPGNNYHVYDVSLFWQNLRGDLTRRLAGWK